VCDISLVYNLKVSLDRTHEMAQQWELDPKRHSDSHPERKYRRPVNIIYNHLSKQKMKDNEKTQEIYQRSSNDLDDA